MLKKAFNRQFEGIIWRVRPDETASCLVLEVRNSEKKTASFSCIDTASGNLTFENFRLPESWFCGLEGVAHGFAYLHGYLSETLPEHRGIFAARLESGEIVWQDYNLVYGYAVREGLIAWNYKSEPRRYQLLDPETGETIRTFSSSAALEQGTSPLPMKPIHIPSKTTLEEEWLAHLPPGALPAADMLEFEQGWVLAFYTAAGEGEGEGEGEGKTTAKKKLDHHLFVIDRNRQLILKDLLAEGILQPAMDTFFVMGNQLYYIKSKSEILAYFL